MRALVLHPVASRDGDRDPRDALAEAVSLAAALDLEVVGARAGAAARGRGPARCSARARSRRSPRGWPRPRSGSSSSTGRSAPVQQRNLEKAWKAKVLDRTGLILEIFGDRARTREGVLQVELAHLSYQKSRLVRSWTHLERQRGGFGFLGGPGETQIEADRRALDERIQRIKTALAKVVRTRGQHRQRPPAGAVAGGGAGRLHQRRQVDAVQPADRLGGAGEGHAVRDARPDDAGDRAAGRAAGDPVATPSASSPTCRTSSSPPSARRSRRCWRPT